MSSIVNITQQNEEQEITSQEPNEKELKTEQVELTKTQARTQIIIDSEAKVDKLIRAKWERMKVVENDRETIIKELAVEIAALPGIVKERVARMIVNGFKRLHVDTVHYSYVYQVLDQEYKSKPLSDRAKQNAKKAKDILEAQIANGYDQKADKYIDSLKDVSQADIDGDQFRGYTYKRIIAWKNDIIAQQAETIERLQRENADLRKELRKALNK